MRRRRPHRALQACASIALLGASLAVATTASASGLEVPALRFAKVVSMPAVPSGGGTLGGLSCPAPRRCVAVGGTALGHAGFTTGSEADGTWTWSAFRTLGAVSVSADSLTSVSCPTETSCVAVGYAEDGGAASPWDTGYAITASATESRGTWRWSGPTALPSGTTGVDRLTSISCPTPSLCVAVGLNVGQQGITASATLEHSQWTWTAATGVGEDGTAQGELRAVSCPTSSRCVAVGDDDATHFGAPTGLGVTTEGTRTGSNWAWSTEADVTSSASGATSLTSVSCPSAIACVAVGANGDGVGIVSAATLHAATWSWTSADAFNSGPIGRLGPYDVSSVSCAPSSCIAVGNATDGDGVFVRAPGPLSAGSWSPAREVPSGDGDGDSPSPEALDCALVNDCVQVGVEANDDNFWSATVAPPAPVRAVRARGVNDGATVRWTPPAFDGGARIASYEAKSTPGGHTCSVRAGNGEPDACTVHGLTDGAHYRFRVTANNGIGVSRPSARSGSITPNPFQPPVASPFTPAVRAYVASAPDVMTVSVYDVSTGQQWTIDGASVQHTASIVKVDILATLLYDEQRAHTKMSPATRELATEMIEESDNNAAQALYVQIGQVPGITAFNRLAGLTGTTPNWAWGFTDTTALDQTRLVRLFAVPNRLLDDASRGFGLGLMRNVESSQAWGVSAGPTRGVSVALKNGWYPTAALDWQVNSIGWVAGKGRDYVIAVLTKDNATMGTGVGAIEGLSTLLWRNLARKTPKRH